MPLGQFDGALEANSIDGAIMPVTQIAEFKLEERLNNYLLTEFGPQTAFAITMNGQRFADLPGPLRDALLEAADQFVPVAAQAYCDAGKSTLDDLKKKGMRTQRFFNSRREQWIAALPPLGQLWASAREAEGYPGSEILTAYMDNLRAAGAKPKRDWDLDPAPTN
jgi:TRAP-type C4-dicarboxylate transport system substrate-binding protein